MRDKYRLNYCEGMILESKNGGPFKIIRLENYDSVLIEFQDEFKYRMKTNIGNVRRLTVGNPYARTKMGIGYLGETNGKLTKNTKAYKVWSGMFERCYNPDYIGVKSYVGAVIHEVWHSFKNFEAWFSINYVEGYQLDKDILVDGNKTYGPDTCVFVPKEVNSFFSQRSHSSSASGFAGVMPHMRDNLWVAGKGAIYTKNLEEAVVVQKKYREDLAKKLYDKYDGFMDTRALEKLKNYDYLTFRP